MKLEVNHANPGQPASVLKIMVTAASVAAQVTQSCSNCCERSSDWAIGLTERQCRGLKMRAKPHRGCDGPLMNNISVSICSPGQDIGEHWAALTRRAAGNVFMNPIALKVAQATDFAQVRMLLAWQRGAQPARLVGLWAFEHKHMTPLWPSFLAAPPYDYAFLSNPVVDPEFLNETIAAFFDAIESERSLPNVVRLRYLDASS